MAVYPDSHTILEEFMGGLPQTMISRCFCEHHLTTEVNSLDDWVGAAKDICGATKRNHIIKTVVHCNLTTPLSTAPRQIAKAIPKTRPVAKEKEEDVSPQRPRVAPARRFACPSRGGRGGMPKTAHQREKRCFNCDEVGHFSRDCPKSHGQRVCASRMNNIRWR
jgi:hypothetical protein